ncbi:MAG: serine--tRNA ligase [Crocinitomicaceae bacterium]|nr:serine--tRNA ligase [Crocinitomicaceae bacterium]|tara:strand:+ start:803 stop:2074 length:1272 start_codon:yes stop_codon:yes gene_type:complete
MLEIQKIRSNKEFIIEQLLKIRKTDVAKEINEIFQLDEKKRETQQLLDSLSANMNTLSANIGKQFKAGNVEKANQLKSETGKLKEEIKQLKADFIDLENQLKNRLYEIPNVPNESVPSGSNEADNEVVFQVEFSKNEYASFLPHWELCEKYNLIDFELGVKITGAGFPVYKGKGARLQRALIQFFLNEANDNGYGELLVPHLVNESSGYGTGQLPDKEGQMYHVGNENLYLIPTAEVPITNIYRDTIIDSKELPKKHVGYTPCFRREAGSYGKEVRGLNRLHQFDKVEVVQVTHPSESYKTLENMVGYVESLIKKLKLPYRKLKLCGGDLGFTSALTFDLEVFSVGQNKWLEVSSISNFETFQANRLKLRFRDNDNKIKLAHTLNGSALALPRIMASLLEINQTDKGIMIPDVLVPYTGFKTI